MKGQSVLNALCVSTTDSNHAGEVRAAASMQRQGFRAGRHFAWDGGTLATWGHPTQDDGQSTALHSSTGIACCVGPLWYRNRFGAAALPILLDDLATTGQLDEAELSGNFAAFLQTGNHCLLLNDLLGYVRIYASSDRAFYSTSWLATCAYVARAELDAAAAVEYVLLGATHADDTVVQGVHKLPLASAFDLSARCVRPRPRLWAEATDRLPTLDDAVATITPHLQATFQRITTAFPNGIHMALSGGFDSRLILAGVLNAGARPELFVYGDPASPDAQIARSVADHAGLSLEVIDKETLDRGRAAPGRAQLVNSALFFDGLPNDGLWDLGSDQITRLDQTAGGRAVLNGGGGEIFRNYFHLPDRRFSALDIVRAFYRGFDRAVFRRPRDLAAYEARMAAAVLRAIDAGSGDPRQPLDRARVELAYPLFRCHHWMAVNNSVGVRHGHYLTPLVDAVATRMAWRLPLAWKNAGRLESRLITALHPGVAGQMSEYGFRFSDGPTQSARLHAWKDRMRPVFARPLIGALGRSRRGDAVSPGFASHCRMLLSGEWCMDTLLDLEHLPDDHAFARALAVEVVWRELR